MATPQCLLAFAPFGVGVMCALTYFERAVDVYGWWVGARDTEYQSAYFKLEDFYTKRATRFYATADSDLYGGWRRLYSSKEADLDPPVAVDPDAAHELERVQDHFVLEWLFFEGDEREKQERIEYDRANFPLRAVNIRPCRLHRFERDHPMWLHRSPGFDGGVLAYLQRYWPLDYC